MKKTWLLAAILAAFIGSVSYADETVEESQATATPAVAPTPVPVSKKTRKPSKKTKASAPDKIETLANEVNVAETADQEIAQPAKAAHKTIKASQATSVDKIENLIAAASTPESAKASAPQDYAPAQDLLFSALGLIGVKYRWGGNDPSQGLDCSGFVRYVFQSTLKVALPRTALAMSKVGDSVDKESLKPGDLVFFNTLKRQFSHVGIYLGDNRFIHSPRKGRSIEVANMDQKYWTSRFNGARRMSEAEGGAVDVASLLAHAGNKQSEVKNQANANSSTCRKVTTGAGKKKKTISVCSKPVTAKTKVATKKTTAKPAVKKKKK